MRFCSAQKLFAEKPVLMIEVHSIANMFNVVTFLNSISYEMELIGKVNQSVCYIEARPKNENTHSIGF